MRRIIAFFFLLILILNVQGQEYLGRWKSHLPYNQARGLTIAGEKIWCSTQGGLFYFNKADNSINTFSKENGLSDSEISTLSWSEAGNSLVIAYSNSNLDIIEGNSIFNLPDIKNKQMPGIKNIYNIYFNDHLAYLSCGFGIVVLDLQKKEIKETYLIGPGGSQLKINQVTLFEGKIYAATDKGLYQAELSSPNLSDFNNWTRVPGFDQENHQIKSIVSDNENIYLILDHTLSDSDSLFQSSDNGWTLYPHFQRDRLISLNIHGDQLLISSRYEVDIFNKAGENIKHFFVGSPVFAAIDAENTLWIADNGRGLIQNPNKWDLIEINPEGPPGIEAVDLLFKNGKLLVAAGGTTSGLGNLYRAAHVYIYENNDWSGIRIDSLKDLISLEIDPDDNTHFFAASWGYGLLEFQGDQLKNHYTDKNSSLQTIFANDYFYRLGGIVYDNQKNLWITNSGVAEPLSVLTSEGDWISFPISNMNNLSLGDIIITQAGHKWFILQGGNGLFVYDDKGTLENDDDDEMKRVSIVDRNNKVITNTVYSIAEDRKGNIWLGTNEGILVYYSPSRVFSGENFYAQQIIVPRNDGSGLGDPLLGTETVTCIEVDGANRKWLGTRNGGAFLVSEDGLEEIHSFNAENSPLLSNNISDISINPETGEVYFATNNGIISYISDATEPEETFRDVYVFPNPVREDYYGDIVISGLVENTYVKITDVNGNLVHETRSLGGQAIWNGENLHNERVSTGVYLVFCSTEDGLQTHVAKLLFIH